MLPRQVFDQDKIKQLSPLDMQCVYHILDDIDNLYKCMYIVGFVARFIVYSLVIF